MITKEIANAAPPVKDIHRLLDQQETINELKAQLGSSDPNLVRKVITGIKLTVDKNYTLQRCTPESILSCAVDAVHLGLIIDKRELVYMIPYKPKNAVAPIATLQISWKGFVNKLKSENPTTDIHVGIVFKGDEFDYEIKNGTVTYKHAVALENKFTTSKHFKQETLIGAYCVIYYTIDGERRGCIETMSEVEIQKIAACNKMKEKTIWSMWTSEMIKKSVIKRACKVHFAGALQSLVDRDNQDYDLTNMPRQPKEVFDSGQTIDIENIDKVDELEGTEEEIKENMRKLENEIGE